MAGEWFRPVQEHEANKSQLRQFAIAQSINMLEAAGVAFPDGAMLPATGEKAVFDIDPKQLATTADQISGDTRLYIGVLTPGIFDLFAKHNIKEVYTSYPEGKISFQEITIGGKSKKELEAELERKKIQVGSYARDLIRSEHFTTLKSPETLQTVRIKAKYLSRETIPTTEQIFAGAEELGLEPIPAEAGVHLRLSYTDQPLGEVLFAGMKPITDSSGAPHVFGLERGRGGLLVARRLGGSRWRVASRGRVRLFSSQVELKTLKSFFVL